MLTGHLWCIKKEIILECYHGLVWKVSLQSFQVSLPETPNSIQKHNLVLVTPTAQPCAALACHLGRERTVVSHFKQGWRMESCSRLGIGFAAAGLLFQHAGVQLCFPALGCACCTAKPKPFTSCPVLTRRDVWGGSFPTEAVKFFQLPNMIVRQITKV